MGEPHSAPARRPLKSRSSAAAGRAAAWLARHGVAPNAISLSSIAFSAGAGAALAVLPAAGRPGQVALLLAAAVCIQLRLAANLLDGLVAVEGGLGGRTGELFNDAPDRLADALVLVGAGYGTGLALGGPLGWAAATLAILTAYVRVLGGSLALAQDFSGPMAKPHRMALVTAACLVSALEVAVSGHSGAVLAVALALVVLGSALTCALRLRRIARRLEAR